MSKANSSIPMWSHYARKHTGFVLGINVDDPAMRHFVQRRLVRYRKNRVATDPYLKPPSNSWIDQITKTIFTKSNEWKYEQEFRVIFRLQDLYPRPLDDGGVGHFLDVSETTVPELIIGCCASDETKAALCDLLDNEKRFSRLRVFAARRHHRQFQIEIVPTNSTRLKRPIEP